MEQTGKRKSIKPSLRRDVLIEAGYRCANPTCRTILAIDLHHIIEVEKGGPNELSNLLALCPTCHALYTRGTISQEAINVWKTILVALNHAFDKESISNLLFLRKISAKTPYKRIIARCKRFTNHHSKTLCRLYSTDRNKRTTTI